MNGYWGTLGYRFGKFLPAISATRLEVNTPGVGWWKSIQRKVLPCVTS